VEVLADEMFPCDMLLLYSKTESGICHIKTANLDGETNLKQRAIPSKMPLFSSQEELADLRGVVSCEKPNARLYEFKGTLLVGDKIYAINNENILLRGTSLQVAPAIYGCAIYAGLDTKMMINSKFKSNKMSCVEKLANLINMYSLKIYQTCYKTTICTLKENELFCSLIYSNTHCLITSVSIWVAILPGHLQEALVFGRPCAVVFQRQSTAF
jgi:magnesium-transporting ATPase (P-type)